ncbi:uncharacterized protein [Asterias amurensis]|uniref:uncharacterized protein isoform X1 n=1 Tax=Asterias amurensis TaxID=7602 RepID=UPI003AB31D12
MDTLCTNDMLFTELCGDHTHLNSDLPQAMRVSLSGEDDGQRSMLTPPDSPVFAELTTPNGHHKGLYQDGVVPNLEFLPLCDNFNMNTVYSPFSDQPFCEGLIRDAPFGSSTYVPAMQGPDFTDYTDCISNWNQQSYPPSAYEVNRSTFDAPFETLPNVENFLKTLAEPSRPTGHNSAGEETEFDSESEASFTLPNSPATSDDGYLSLSSSFNPQHRTHNYQRRTVDKQLSVLRGVTNKSCHKRGRGRPRKMHSSTSGEDSDEEVTTRRGRGRRDAMRGNHLWEFIRDLLKDNHCCPKFIRWEDRKDGVFRFVNSEAVARMWGQKKNNPHMTYEKLSRAMRYYYKREILERVDGRRLVYKFGKKALGWREAAGLEIKTESA